VLKKIETDKAPKAIGPYSQAVAAGDYLFVSGQIAINQAGSVSGDMREQTRRVLSNIKGILAGCGIGMERVVKTTVYLKDLAHFAEMNEEYAAHFTSEPKPARETVQVAKLPKDALVEISCIAYLGE